jgi:hypothetical protein
MLDHRILEQPRVAGRLHSQFIFLPQLRGKPLQISHRPLPQIRPAIL